VIATTLFVEFLLGCLSYASSDCGGYQGSQLSLKSLVHTGDPLWQIMRQNGWCPSELMPMCQELNTSGVLFLNNITRPNCSEEHKSICVISKTSSENIETSQFEQSHRLCKVYECPFRQLSKDEAQKIALQKMRQTYKDATAVLVLVLDSWLLSCEVSRKPETETLMRIFNSPWNRRLWTFQGGALPKSRMFQFGDVCL
jgi:hypothetical protein